MKCYSDIILPLLLSRITHVLEQHPDSFAQVKESCYLLCSLGDNLLREDSLFICTANRCLTALDRFQGLDEIQQISSETLARKVQSYLDLFSA